MLFVVEPLLTMGGGEGGREILQKTKLQQKREKLILLTCISWLVLAHKLILKRVYVMCYYYSPVGLLLK